jgi:sec-independent protein translocase protein TatA
MDIGPAEIIIVLLVVVLLFGGAKLPKLARSLGSAKGEFEKGLKEGAKASDEADKSDKAAKAADEPAAPKAVEAGTDTAPTGTVSKDETTA